MHVHASKKTALHGISEKLLKKVIQTIANKINHEMVNVSRFTSGITIR